MGKAGPRVSDPRVRRSHDVVLCRRRLRGGGRTGLVGVTQAWVRLGHGTVEGPSVFAWGSRFVLLYSGGDWREQYGMGYAISASPLGPFVKSTTPLLSGGAGLAGPGGGS